jgi:hypothetical protein
MTVDADTLGRITKLFIDRDDTSLEEAAALLAGCRLILRCGPEVDGSATWQAAVLTAANIACRCFPGGVRVQGVGPGPLRVPWMSTCTFSQALVEVVGEDALRHGDQLWTGAIMIAFGTVGETSRSQGIQVTFDGWTCAVSPLTDPIRLSERDGCVLAGVAVGALAVSEVFLGTFGFAVDAGARTIGLSLWRPDLPWDAPGAAGVQAPIRHLPGEVWLLGLGHLGQAFAWAFGLLPFSQPKRVNVILQDFDRLVHANLDTGLISSFQDEGCLKTRVVSAFLEGRQVKTRLIERRFDEYTHPQLDEPRIVLAGMDGQGPRHLLDKAGFDLVIDCGIGGTVANFDSITINVLPNPRLTAANLWPQADNERDARRTDEATRLASSRGVYKEVLERRGCGHVDLAGRAVAVPFVGAVSAALVLSELLRRVMGATQFDRIRMQLTLPTDVSTTISTRSGSPLRAPFQSCKD